MKPIRVIELFAGIGAQRQALKDAGVPHEAVAIAEIDKHAIRSYMAIHGDTPNLGDVSKVDHLPDCDFLTYSFPCQDLSVAGRQAGMTKGSGTRSGLLWEVERLLLDMRERERLPQYLLMENVDAILNSQNLPDFMKWVRSLTDMGYTSSYKILNSTSFGVPQSRKRCFMVSILHGPVFKFPKGESLTKCLKDILEDDVDDSYDLPPSVVEGFIPNPPQFRKCDLIQVGNLTHGGYEISNRVYSVEGPCPTLTTGSKDRQPKICTDYVITGWIDKHGDWVNPVYSTETVSPTVTACQGGHRMPKISVSPHHIRYVTPRECWRLQGQPDENYDKALESGVSKAQLYKQAGNSITVNVLTAIFRELFPEGGYKGVRCTLDMF